MTFRSLTAEVLTGRDPIHHVYLIIAVLRQHLTWACVSSRPQSVGVTLYYHGCHVTVPAAAINCGGYQMVHKSSHTPPILQVQLSSLTIQRSSHLLLPIQTIEAFSIKIPEAMHDILSRIASLSSFNAVVACAAVLAFIKLIHMSRMRLHTPKLRGPPSPSFAYGVGKILVEVDDPASMYELWAREYGAAYEVPSTLWRRRIVLYDPKAIAHFHAKQSWTYVRTPFAKKSLEHGVCVCLLCGASCLIFDHSLGGVCFGLMERATEGMFLNPYWRRKIDGPARQRKSLTPAFSIAAIRHLTSVFYDSAHKVLTCFLACSRSSHSHWLPLGSRSLECSY